MKENSAPLGKLTAAYGGGHSRSIEVIREFKPTHQSECQSWQVALGPPRYWDSFGGTSVQMAKGRSASDLPPKLKFTDMIGGVGNQGNSLVVSYIS